MDKRERAEVAFERVWEKFRADKARLRTLNEKEKADLKDLMKTIFMSSMSLDPIPPEINLKLDAGGSGEEVEGTVRRVLQEELGGITGLLKELKDRPVETRVVSGGGGGGGSSVVAAEPDEVVAFHGRMFEANMSTNIDDVQVSGEDVKSVKSNLEALRKLQKKKG